MTIDKIKYEIALARSGYNSAKVAGKMEISSSRLNADGHGYRSVGWLYCSSDG